MVNFQKYDHLNFDIVEPVLDIGGGNENMMEYFNVEDATILDIENNSEKEYDFIKADIRKKLPKIDKKFKTIFIFETLEHIENPLYLMAQVYDLLDEKGKVYISMPYTPLDLNRERTNNIYYCHVCRWTLREIKNQMNKLGFDVKVLWKRRRFKNMGFWLPHCWFTLELKKKIIGERK